MLPPALFRSDAATNPRLLDQLMAPANTILTDFIRGVYRDGALDDFKFTQLGVQRTLGQCASGRDFIQQCREVHGEPLARASFFDSLHSPRRRSVLAELNSQLVRRARSRSDDLLTGFPELKNRPLYAVDGHHLDHAVHSPRDDKAEYVSANNLYVLCLHSGLLCNLGAVQGDGIHRHEMPVFRQQVVAWLAQRGADRLQLRPILVLDPAFVDNQFWTLMMLNPEGALFITRMKANMKPVIYSARGWDVGLAVNEGVLADLLVGFDNSCTMRLIRYRDPESSMEYEFLTSVTDLSPGLISLIYLLRWRIEKVFDTGKNKLQETKSWAVGKVAQDIRAHFFALTHNLLVLLRRQLELEEGIREETVEQKRREALKQRKRQAALHGRKVASVQSRLDKVTGSKFTFLHELAVKFTFVRSARVEWVRFPLGCLHPFAGGLA